jgi:hypothetical protein
MEKRPHAQLDDAYHDFSTLEGAAVYEHDSFAGNRADSIQWARIKAAEVLEISDFLNRLRSELRQVLMQSGDGFLFQMLGPADDLNHFLVLVGDLTLGERYAPGIRAFARDQCVRLKSELNLDLLPALFKAERPHKKRPINQGFRLPGGNE